MMSTKTPTSDVENEQELTKTALNQWMRSVLLFHDDSPSSPQQQQQQGEFEDLSKDFHNGRLVIKLLTALGKRFSSREPQATRMKPALAIPAIKKVLDWAHNQGVTGLIQTQELAQQLVEQDNLPALNFVFYQVFLSFAKLNLNQSEEERKKEAKSTSSTVQTRLTAMLVILQRNFQTRLFFTMVWDSVVLFIDIAQTSFQLNC
mgnify:CR=1 FL=1